MSAVLEISRVCKAFVDGSERRQVLDGVTLRLAPGETVAVQGPSGSGKTTLLNVVAGLLTPDAGELRLRCAAGQLELHALDAAGRTRARRLHMGYVFQFFNLVPTLTVRENVLLPLELVGRPGLEARALARLAGLGLGERLDDFPQRLSGGERQRVAIARALAHEPVLVLADEPTGNLDAANAARVAELLVREVTAVGGVLLVATHDARVAALADRVLELGAWAASR